MAANYLLVSLISLHAAAPWQFPIAVVLLSIHRHREQGMGELTTTASAWQWNDLVEEEGACHYDQSGVKQITLTRRAQHIHPRALRINQGYIMGMHRSYKARAFRHGTDRTIVVIIANESHTGGMWA